MDNNIQSCRENLNRVFEINQNNSVAYDLEGLIYLKEGNYSQAIQSFDKAIALNPEFAILYYNRSLANRFLKQTELAQMDLDQAIKKVVTILIYTLPELL